MRKPDKKRAVPRHSVTSQLLTIIEARAQSSGQSSYAIAREAGIDPGILARLISGERDIRLATLDRLADSLGLRLVEIGKKVRPARLAQAVGGIGESGGDGPGPDSPPRPTPTPTAEGGG